MIQDQIADGEFFRAQMNRRRRLLVKWSEPLFSIDASLTLTITAEVMVLTFDPSGPNEMILVSSCIWYL